MLHKYEFDLLKDSEINVELLNEQATEGQQFTRFLADASKSGWKADDKRLQEAIRQHKCTLLNRSYKTEPV